MYRSDLMLLYDYNYWANRRILDAAARSTEAQLHQPQTLSWGSVHGTLVHALSAEWVWRMRCSEGVSPTAMLSQTELATLETLRLRWEAEEQAMRRFLAGLSDPDLTRIVDYRNTRGQPFSAPLGPILVHVVNHGTQHRAEAAHFLTEFGHSPGDMDLILYVLQHQPAGQ